MSDLTTLNLEHLPPAFAVHIALFSPISNAAFLHHQLLAGNSDFEYALIDASVIVSRTHVLAAAWRAINDSIEGRLKSRNVHSEIVLSLSPSNNIAESFRRFGLTSTTKSLLVIKVSSPTAPFTSSDVQAHLRSSVDGTQVEFTNVNLEQLTELTKVKKYYKLNSGSGGKKLVNGHVNGGGAEVDEQREREVSILGAMALRGIS